MTNGAKIDQKITLDSLEWEVMKTNSKTTANILSVLCHLYYSLSHPKKPAIWHLKEVGPDDQGWNYVTNKIKHDSISL